MVTTINPDGRRLAIVVTTIGDGSFLRLLTILKDSRCTSVFFVSPSRLRASLSRMQTVLGNRHVVVAVDLTKATQQILAGTINQMLRRHQLHFPDADVTLVVAGL